MVERQKSPDLQDFERLSVHYSACNAQGTKIDQYSRS